MPQISKYHPLLVATHWIMAVLIIFDLSMGELRLTSIPNSSPDKVFALRIHMILGTVIAVLLCIRLILRLMTRHPAPAATGNHTLDKIVLLSQRLFYVLVFAMVSSGVATAIAAHLPSIVFGGHPTPLPDSFDGFPTRMVHGFVAGVLIAYILLHLIAALYHHYILKDGLLRRMWFGTATESDH